MGERVCKRVFFCGAKYIYIYTFRAKSSAASSTSRDDAFLFFIPVRPPSAVRRASLVYLRESIYIAEREETK